MNFLILFTASRFLALSVTSALADFFFFFFLARNAELLTLVCIHLCTKPPELNSSPWDPVLDEWEWCRILLGAFQEEFLY